MNLDELQSVRDRERQTDKLQQLRETFYEDAGEFIQQLRDQRERAAERADDPFDAPEVSRLSDEIDTAEQTVEAIYEKRVGKIVKAASFAAADLPAESDGMTAEEQDLFETLVENIKTNRKHVMDVLDGSAGESPVETGTDTTATTETPPAEPGHRESTGSDGERPTPPEPDSASPPDSGVSAADAMGSGSTTDTSPTPPEESGPGTSGTPGETGSQTPPEPPEPEPEVRNDGGATAADTDAGATTADENAGVERETVRITADVGDFLGIDEREYDLSENDVVTLPATNVEPLVSRDAAERLD